MAAITVPALGHSIYSAAMCGRVAALEYVEAYKLARSQSDARLKAVRQTALLALIALGLTTKEAKTVKSASAMTCPVALWKEAERIQALSKETRKAEGVANVFQAALVKLNALEREYGLKKARDYSKRQPRKDVGKVAEGGKPIAEGSALVHAKGAPALPKEARATYKPRTFAEIDTYALSAAQAFALLAKGQAKLFTSEETPNRARALQRLMTTFADAVAKLPKD